MSQDTPAPPPPPPGSKPPGSTGPTPPGPAGPSGPAGRGTPPGGGRGPQDPRDPWDARDSRDSREEWATGGTVFAGTLLAVAGILAVLEGIVGIAKDSVYVASNNYTYEFNTASWGWIHLILGVIAIFVGYGLLRGAEWARWVGIFIAGLNLIANFIFLPYQPVWSVIMVGIDVFVIWALAAHHPSNAGRSGAGRTGAGRSNAAGPGGAL